MTTPSFSWPAHYPSDCPPEDACPSNEVFFRIVDGSNPTIRDFLSHTELVAMGLRRPIPDADPVLAAGLSMESTLEAAERTRQSNGPMRRKKIARGSLQLSGVEKQTGSRQSHHTWWRPVDDAAWRGFQVQS